MGRPPGGRAGGGEADVSPDARRVRLSRDLVTDLATPHDGVLTRAQLRAAGADDSWITRRVEAGDWQRLHRGVFATFSGPVPWITSASAALAYAGEGAALSHRSAARLLGFTARPPRVVDVTVPESRRVTPTDGIVLHRRTTMPAVGGRPPRTLGADTVLDLVAAARDVDDAVGWLCAAARAGVPPGAVAGAASRRGPFPRRGLLLELVAEVAAGIESPLERRYHGDVERRHGLPCAVLQRRDVVGGLWIRADCVYEGLGVRVELDGWLGHPGARTDADTWRDNAVLLARGDLTLRYRWRHVTVTPCSTATQVAAALAARGWSGNPRPCGRTCVVAR